MKRLWVLALVVAVGCKNGPSEDQCKQFLDHLIDLEFKKAGVQAGSGDAKSELAKQKAALSEAKAPEFMESCTKKMAKARIECGLGANDLDAIAKCDDVGK